MDEKLYNVGLVEIKKMQASDGHDIIYSGNQVKFDGLSFEEMTELLKIVSTQNGSVGAVVTPVKENINEPFGGDANE